MIAIIPARGGSKGLPNKNILSLGGTPLIAWGIIAAQLSGLFSRIIVSTNSSEIAEIALAYGAEVPFMRPSELATDCAATRDVVLHLLEQLELQGSSEFCLMQPTSPFRTSQHLQEATALFHNDKCESLVSVSAGKPVSWAFNLEESTKLVPVSESKPVDQRQKSQKTVYPNGAIYLQNIDTFMKHPNFITANTWPYEMNKIDSLDIDDVEDFKLAEAIILHDHRTPR
jgi:CMP-N-acetylneuraminic acid synthetase